MEILKTTNDCIEFMPKSVTTQLASAPAWQSWGADAIAKVVYREKNENESVAVYSAAGVSGGGFDTS